MFVRMRHHLLAMVLLSSGVHAEDGCAHDVAFLSESHIVVSRWLGGVAVSRDGGKSWRGAVTVPIRQLAVCVGSRIWGFHAWRGIHEPPEAVLTCSRDGGDSWTKIELQADEVMPAAFVNRRENPALLLAGDGQLWSPAGEPIDSWETWKRVGRANPDGVAVAGLDSGEALYVASSHRVWISRDEASSWSSVDVARVAEIVDDGAYCWAVDFDGVLHRTRRGLNEWKRFQTLPSLEIPLGMACHEGRVLVAGEGEGWKAYCAVIHADRSRAPMKGLRGRQAYSVRFDPSGRAWCVADGLHRETSGAWRRIWPGR